MNKQLTKAKDNDDKISNDRVYISYSYDNHKQKDGDKYDNRRTI